MFKTPYSRTSGLMLIELIVVSAISVVVFGALFVTFQFTLELVANTRAKLSALSLANDRMEYFRSLPYDDVGVVAGFPAGTIPQTSSLTLNDITFNERVLVDYVDDPSDNTAGIDDNTITTDYKQLRLVYQWEVNGEVKEVALTSYIVPRSIETNVGGGTARIVVLDADSAPLSGASVRLFNSSTTFPFERTVITNPSGMATFAVPEDSGYQVEVSGVISGQQYSTSSTYVATTTNENPVVGPFAVVEAGISTLTFLIDELSDLDVSTKSAVVEDSVYEPFADALGIASSAMTNVTAGELRLQDAFGVYETTGTAYLNPVTPAIIANWETIRVAADVPVDTNYVVQLYVGDAIGGYALIPDAELPGNSTGFTDTLIDISSLDTFTYATTTVGITLNTTDTSVTPAIEEIEIYWRESDTALANVTLDVRGDKILGTQDDLSLNYKSTSTITTDVSGEFDMEGLEFDAYTFTPTGAYDLASACASHPYNLQAGVDDDLEFVYVANAANTLRVSVVDGLGRAIPSVDVRLQRSGYDVTQTTNTCGQTFFTGGLSDNNDYTLDIMSAGYVDDNVSSFAVSGDTFTEIILLP